MIIKKIELPEKSILKRSNKSYDYIDSYKSELIDDEKTITSTEIGKLFFTTVPKWGKKLFIIRDKIVGLLGLKTSENITSRQKQLEGFKCEPGEQVGLFKVFSKSNNEVVIGEDDKHLNFRVSLLLDKIANSTTKQTLTITTTVEFNNWFGRLYFFPVRPFHKLIVPSMLKEMRKELKK